MLVTWNAAFVRVWAFGEFRVECRVKDGPWETVDPQEWGRNAHSRHVLRYLLLYGRSAGRGTLMNAIWPGSDSIYLDDYLSKAVSNLRKVFRAEDMEGLVRTKNERTLYELADQSMIWTDMDACEVAMQEAERLGHTSKEAFLLSRRQALITLASLPVMLTAPLLAPLPREEFLPQCAASVTACWHLLRGREFLLIEKLLTRYLPMLADMAHQPSFSYRTDAARLATQGYRLMGILALHRGGALARTAYFEQAVHFAEIAETPNLLAAALISLAYHETDPNKATEFYQRGARKQKELSPLVLARLYARLAVVSAQRAQEMDALHYLHQAQEIYPQAPEKDPCFLYAEFCPSSLTMEVGLTYLALAQQTSPGKYAQQARETFAGVDSVRTPIPAPVRIRYEIVNHEARTSLVMHNLEEFCSLLEKGMHGAKLLQSDQRKQEVLQLYKDARAQWPEETRVRALADLVL